MQSYRQKVFYTQFEAAIPLLSAGHLPPLGFPQFKRHNLLKEIMEAGKALGSKSDKPLVQHATHHAQLTQAKELVVLDEALHFNRYRAITLRLGVYDKLPAFPKAQYLGYCRQFEPECLKSGMVRGQWSDRHGEDWFGKPAAPGDFTGSGAPVWKLRAWQDAIFDLYPLVYPESRVIRFSIYDSLLINKNLVRLGDFLLKIRPEEETILQNYIARKINGPINK
jgi:hypothetical protein